jgi:hypothetical protein
MWRTLRRNHPLRLLQILVAAHGDGSLPQGVPVWRDGQGVLFLLTGGPGVLVSRGGPGVFRSLKHALADALAQNHQNRQHARQHALKHALAD